MKDIMQRDIMVPGQMFRLCLQSYKVKAANYIRYLYYYYYYFSHRKRAPRAIQDVKSIYRTIA